MSSVVFYKNMQPVDEAVIKAEIAQFAINGYDDVPFENLLLYAEHYPGIDKAERISDTSWQMVQHLRSQGFDWLRRQDFIVVRPKGPQVSSHS